MKMKTTYFYLFLLISKYFYRISICLFLFISNFHPCKAQSLEEYLKIAAENNPQLKAKYAEFEGAMQKVAQANSLPDPTLSFGYFISPVETRVGPQRAKIGLLQMFPWFGTLKAAGNVFQLQAEAKYQEFLNAKNELFMQVKAAWYELHEIKMTVLIHEEHKKLHHIHQRLVLTAYKNGKGSMTDVIRVDIVIDDIHTEIRLLEKQLKPLKVRFNKLLNRADMLEVMVDDSLSLTIIPENFRKDSLLVNHPILKSFDLKYESAQQTEKLAKKQGLPKFGVGLDYVFVEKRSDMVVSDNGKDVFMPMVSMSIPLFRGKYNAAIKEAQYSQEAINYHKEAFANTLISGYELAWYELEKSRELIQLYVEQVKKTNQAITLLMRAYSNSGKDFEEVLRMQQELLKYQIAEATAIKTYYTALAKIDYLTAKTE